jgi:hypothetical protein
MGDEKGRYPKTRFRSARPAGYPTYAYTRNAHETGAGFHRSATTFCLTNVQVTVDYWGPRAGYFPVDRAAAYVVEVLEAER